MDFYGQNWWFFGDLAQAYGQKRWILVESPNLWPFKKGENHWMKLKPGTPWIVCCSHGQSPRLLIVCQERTRNKDLARWNHGLLDVFVDFRVSLVALRFAQKL
jgi:hypothetical protein